jgi:hypothetical protein
MKVSWFAIHCTVCLAITAGIVGYDRWAYYGILAQHPEIAEIIDWNVVRIPCSTKRMVGNLMLYKITSGQRYWIHACRDWQNAKWILESYGS